MAKQLYTWEWVGGGYNSCLATSREAALAEAFRMGEPTRGGMTVRLVPNLLTLKQVSNEEMRKIDRSWAASCD